MIKVLAYELIDLCRQYYLSVNAEIVSFEYSAYRSIEIYVQGIKLADKRLKNELV